MCRLSVVAESGGSSLADVHRLLIVRASLAVANRWGNSAFPLQASTSSSEQQGDPLLTTDSDSSELLTIQWGLKGGNKRGGQQKGEK